MTNIPEEFKFTKSHEWVKVEADGTVTVGITDYAQSLLGDLVYIELPEINSLFDAGDECGVVESVKAASDLYCPIAGKVVAFNDELAEGPDLVNTSPYESGWLFKLKPEDVSELDDLLDGKAYQQHISEEVH